jgi:hypothetical protein
MSNDPPTFVVMSMSPMKAARTRQRKQEEKKEPPTMTAMLIMTDRESCGRQKLHSAVFGAM